MLMEPYRNRPKVKFLQQKDSDRCSSIGNYLLPAPLKCKTALNFQKKITTSKNKK